MRAYLIDPFERTITEVDLDDTGEACELLDIEDNRYPALGSGALLPAEDGGSGDWMSDYLYVPPELSFEQYDDLPGTISDDRKIEGDPRDWFQILDSVIDPKQPASFPFPCRGIVVGLDCDGAWVSAGLRLAELRKRVVFAKGKLAGYAASTAIERGGIWTGPVIDVLGGPDNVVKLRKVA